MELEKGLNTQNEIESVIENGNVTVGVDDNKDLSENDGFSNIQTTTNDDSAVKDKQFGESNDSENDVPVINSSEADDFEEDWDDDVEDENDNDEESSDNEDLDIPDELKEIVRDIENQDYSKALRSSKVNEEDSDEKSSIDTEINESGKGEIDAATEIDDELLEEDPEESDEDFAELESVRASAEGIDAEMADLSYLDDLKKKNEPHELTDAEKKDQKKKLAEERKRKRKEENDLFARRYKAKSINAAVAQTNPIIYFYNAILNKKGEVKLFNVYQVLQDRFLGKLVPQLWMAVAEASDRVIDLNMANMLEQMKICSEYPDMEFVITMSTRFFTKPAVLQKLLEAIDKPVSNLVMAFDCVSLQNLGTAAKTGLGQLKSKGIKIILDNTEKVSMTTLSELDFDYIRLDSRYYELGNFKSEGFLRLLTNFAKELGIPTIATFCDNDDMVEYMLYMGVDMVQGNAVSRPMRTVPNAVKAITPVESMINPIEET